MYPELENTDELEKNEGQSYLMLPSECKISLDCEFLQITNYDGSIALIKMPPIIDPMPNQPSTKAPAGAGDGTPSNATPDNLMAPSQISDVVVTISPEIDGVQHSDLVLEEILIGKLAPKQVRKFKDPFKYVADQPDAEGEFQPHMTQDEPTQDEVDEFKYLLGHAHLKDTEGGDAGSLLKKSKYYPYVEFIRSPFCGKNQNSILHSDVPSVYGNAKQMKEYFITTGIVVAYHHTFDVEVYNIQKPSKDSTPGDYSQEYFNRVMV